MRKEECILKIIDIGAMAIVREDSYKRIQEIAQACINGGVPVLEMSFTLNSAGNMIERLRADYGDQLIIGAGTVLDATTARYAILKGAQFIIAPNFNQEVAHMCNLYSIPYAPGCSTLSEALKALEAGASFVKAFPISNFYGPDLVNIFKTPVPYMPILASGGITLDNLSEWIIQGVEVCGFGGLLTKGSSKQIEQNALEIRKKIDENRR